MYAEHIKEPKLQFGASRHVDIRFGLRDYGPFDAEQSNQPKEVRLGIVGTPETARQLSAWFERCQSGVARKESRFHNKYISFPGYGSNGALPVPLAFSDVNTRTIAPRYIDRICELDSPNRAIEKLADLFFEELRHLAQSKNVDVLLCAPPEEVYLLRTQPRQQADGQTSEGEAPDPAAYTYRVDFHDLLKAQSLLLPCPTQLIWPPTYTGKKTDIPGRKTYPLQDAATRAWNLYVALYYKAGGVPWRLVRQESGYETCFVGISFYRSLDLEQAHGSVAQIFNERGEGLIMQGGPARRSGEDRQLHLTDEDASVLLEKTLETYRREHGHAPARLVLHKTSAFSAGEKGGFWEAAEAERVQFMDLLHLRPAYARSFRSGYHAPLRGTFFGFDSAHNYLCTLGSVNFYQLLPSNYMPKTLQFEVADAGSPPIRLAEEILKLTKMNWNNTQIAQKMPVTIEAARHVGNLLKYANREGLPAQALAPRYSYYM